MEKAMVIIGGGMAGARAIIGLRSGGWQGPITLLSREALMPYDRPPLSKASVTTSEQPKPELLLDEGIAASLKAEVRLGQRVIAIDRATRTIELAGGRLGYDKLLIATGAAPRRLTCPGAEHALMLRDFPETLELRDKFQPGRTIAIIGGGFIGLELAASASKRGCSVVVIEALPRILMRGVAEEIAAAVHQRHAAAGVRIMTGVGVEEITGHAVILKDGKSIAADTIVAGIGAVPETKLAAAAGLTIDNGIAVDTHLRTSDPDIYAAGDCCSFPHPLFGNRRIRLESWRNAQDQGTMAGENMAGADKTYAAVPWFWSDQYDLSLQIAGMPGDGTETVRRQTGPDSFLIFHRDAGGRLVGVSGLGTGNSIARDVKLSEMLIAKGINPAPEVLADPAVALKSLLRG